jgi:hypothetical protein
MTDAYKEGYVGVTRFSVSERYNQHLKDPVNPKLRGALRKYDTHVVCLFSDLSQDDALRLEREFRPRDNIGWNVISGGGIPPTQLGVKRSAETLFKLRESHLGKVPGNKGKKATEETRLKLSAKRKLRIISDDTKLRTSATAKARGIRPPPSGFGSENAFFGKTHTEETRVKMRDAWAKRKLRKLETNNA